jgi:WD40 repeat protein
VAPNFTFRHLLSTRRQYAGAFLSSLSAVVFVAAGVGLVLLPRQIARLSGTSDISVMDYQLCREGQRGIMLIREDSSNADALRQHLVVHDVRRSQLTRVQVDFPLLPTCFAVTDRSPSLFVADAMDGGIYAFDLGDIVHLRGCIGRHVQSSPHALACSRDGRTLISLGSREIYAWDLEKWMLRWCRTDEEPACVVILPDSQSIICLTTKTRLGELIEIDLTTGETLQLFSPHADPITQLTASPDGRFVAGTGEGGNVLLFERGSRKTAWHRREFGAFRSGAANVVPAFSPQSNLLVLGHADGRRLVVWDFQRAVPVCEIGACSESPLLGSAFLDQDTLLSWSGNGVITIWDLKSGLASRRTAASDRRELRS